MDMDQGVRIIELRCENVKALKAIEIRPNTNVVQIGGKNGAGKSSVLQAISMVLDGKKAQIKEPVRRGEKVATVIADFGAFKVTLKIKPSGARTLVIESADGSVFKSPQALLDGLRGEVAFDPMAFHKQKPAEQLATLKRVAGVDFTLLDNERDGVYAKRTDVNRRLKEATARYTGQLPPEGASLDERSVEEVQAKLDESREKREAWQEAQKGAGTHRAVLTEAEGRRDRIRFEHEAMVAQIDELIQQKERIAADLSNAVDTVLDRRDDVHVAEEKAANFPKPPDDAITVTLIEEIREHNQQVSSWKDALDIKIDADNDAKISQKLTDRIEGIDAEKKAIIEAAEMPIPGLEFGDNCVIYNGFPLDQVSHSEQMLASAAIGSALSPKMRVMGFEDASLLDDDSMVLLDKFADENDLQIWLERVGTEGVSVVIEEGEIATAPGDDDDILF